jgi:hypothetical protein
MKTSVSINIDPCEVLDKLSINDLIEYYGVKEILREIDTGELCEFMEQELGYELV